MERKCARVAPDVEHKAGKRYLEEIRMIKRECSCGAKEETDEEQDELYPDGPPKRK